MRRSTKRLIFKTILAIFVSILIVLLIRRKLTSAPDSGDIDYFELHSKNIKLTRLDWHDRKLMEEDRKKIGLGEQGKAAFLPRKELMKEKELFSQNGFNAHLSDHISLFRSIRDIRRGECNNINYLVELPYTSIIIIFYNEHWSTLLRTIYTVLSRTPEHLIYEIILVDDGSEKEFLGKQLDDYVAENLRKVQIVRHKIRKGLIAALLTGAKIAKGQVLVFLDSHVEPNYNWLPPLLEPISLNHKIVTCPLIDLIDADTFEYRPQDEGARGGFDWEFHYKRLPLLPNDIKEPTKPFANPVMAGGLFAINRKWFWELGGYDPELDIWGGEQYELSFKIWMCGGRLLDIPCSRIGHIYRGHMISKNPRTGIDFVHRNYKRVAEVWMDEYAKFLYDRDRKAFNNVDAGNLTERRAIRNRLNCKSFNWFMENIAFDVVKYYPPIEPPSYARGIIRSLADKDFCLDSLNRGFNEEPGLYKCTSNDPKNPGGNQNWELTWHKDLKQHELGLCLDAQSSFENAKVVLYPCHGMQGNQLWFYEHRTKLLIHGDKKSCLEANIKKLKVVLNECDYSNSNMMWEFGFHNETALKRFNKAPPLL